MKLNIQGNTPLYLPRDPISPMEAATKSYVDVNLSTHETRADLHLSSDQNVWMDFTPVCPPCRVGCSSIDTLGM